jgi:hypothetical protein
MTIPLQRSQVLKGAAWVAAHFAAPIHAAIAGTPVTLPLVQAIACKETHNIWLGRIDTVDPGTLLTCCVGDASGDAPGSSRSAFPQNTEAFRQNYGEEFTTMLIAEANRARALRGLPPAAWVYKGYGLFQYDLQHVVKDPDFFRNRAWHTIGPCLEKLLAELKRCFKASGGDVRGAVRRYNGSGPRAEEYADHVMQFTAWCEGKA